jgi:hypothetical protein
LAHLGDEQTAKCLYRVRRMTELRRVSLGNDTIMVIDEVEREIIGV